MRPRGCALPVPDRRGTKHAGFTDGFDFHNGFGYIIFLAAVILLVLALVARLGRRRVLMTLGLPLLVIVQIVLAWGGESAPVVGIFHPLVALLIAGFAGRLAYDVWRSAGTEARGAPATPAR